MLYIVPTVLSDYDWSTAIPKLAELEVLADKINQISEAVTFDLKEQYAAQDIGIRPGSDFGSDCDSELGSTVSDLNLEDIVEDLKTCSNSLIDLTPSLEYPANDFLPREDIVTMPVDDLANVAEPARPFVLIIKDRYPSMETNLVKRLGEANWERRERLRKKFELASAMNTASSRGGETSMNSDKLTDRSHQDSAMEQPRPSSTMPSSIDLSSTYQSIFDDNSSAFQSIQLPRMMAESVTSFASSMAGGGENSQRRVPSLPEGYKIRSPFQCPICGETLKNIRNRGDWK
jgi:hypothetical protein